METDAERFTRGASNALALITALRNGIPLPVADLDWIELVEAAARLCGWLVEHIAIQVDDPDAFWAALAMEVADGTYLEDEDE